MRKAAIFRFLAPSGPFAAALSALCAAACAPSEGLAPAEPAETHVLMDFYHRPLPEIPLPNDIATRYDAASATGTPVLIASLPVEASAGTAPTPPETVPGELLQRRPDVREAEARLRAALSKHRVDQ